MKLIRGGGGATHPLPDPDASFSNLIDGAMDGSDIAEAIRKLEHDIEFATTELGQRAYAKRYGLRGITPPVPWPPQRA